MAGKSSKRKRFSSGNGIKMAENPPRRLAWNIILAAIAVIMAGYALLLNADPIGKNIYSSVAPFFLIGGHILVVLGLIYTPGGSH